MNHRNISLALLFLFVASATVSARTAKILYFKAPKNAPKDAFLYQGTQEPIPVQLSQNNFSDSIELEDGATKLYFLPKAIAPDSEDFPKNAPFLNIPEAWSKVLIFVFNDPSNTLIPVKFEAVNANSDKLGLGDVMFINHSDDKIFGTVGRKKLALKERSLQIIRNPAKPSAEYNVVLKRVKEESNQAVVFFRKVWRQSEHQSSLVLIYKSPGSKRLSYYSAPIRGL